MAHLGQLLLALRAADLLEIIRGREVVSQGEKLKYTEQKLPDAIALYI